MTDTRSFFKILYFFNVFFWSTYITKLWSSINHYVKIRIWCLLLYICFGPVSQSHLTESVCQGSAVSGSRTQTKETKYTQRTTNIKQHKTLPQDIKDTRIQNSRYMKHVRHPRRQKYIRHQKKRSRHQTLMGHKATTQKNIHRHQETSAQDVRRLQKHQTTWRDIKRPETTSNGETKRRGESWPL